MDGSGNLYIDDRYNHRIRKFPPNSTSATAGLTVAGGNGPGSAPTQLFYPQGMYVDGHGNLYVADLGNSRVQSFPPNSTSATAGTTLAGENGYGFGPRQLAYPYDVYVDRQRNLYVSEQNGFRVKKCSYPPVITSQPVASFTVCNGAAVTAQVSATATIPGSGFSYQWYSASGPISGQTSPVLSLTNLQVSQAGSYYIVITSMDSGLSTTSINFQLSVLSAPNANLVASGSLSPASPSVTLTASGGIAYQFGLGVTQVDNGPTAMVSAPGLYFVNVTGGNGCSTVASTVVSQATTADLSPLLCARSTGLSGNSPITVVVNVYELNGISTTAPITVRITKDAKGSLSFDASQTSVGGKPVQNSQWRFSGPSGGYYTLTSDRVLSGNELSMGLTGVLASDALAGVLTVTGVVVGEERPPLTTTLMLTRSSIFSSKLYVQRLYPKYVSNYKPVN